MPLPLIAPLTWTSMSDTLNLRKRPGLFLSNILGIDEETLPTETVEINTIRGERDIAPFVRVGAEAIMVAGLGSEGYVIKAPNIRIKRPFSPGEHLFNRRPGEIVYPTNQGQVISAIEKRIADDLAYMDDMIVNAEEWMAAMALRGAISYSVADDEVFTITIPRAAAHSVTPSVFWDGTPGNITAIANIRAIISLVAENGQGITDAIMGSEAEAWFYKLPEMLSTINLNSGIKAGGIDLTQGPRADGAIFLGRWLGINWWSYPRKLRLNGSAIDLIRPKYVEFISAGQGGWKRYYGAIPDMDALEGRKMQAKRFAKSWKQPDPSALMALVQSRPLVYPRVVDSTVSYKAISG